MSLSFVLSVQHTGTWFVIRTLEKSPDISSVLMATELSAVEFASLRQAPVRYCVHDHLHYNLRQTEYVNPEALDVPITVPIRDPLLALISRQARQPLLEHVFVVMTLCKLPTIISRYNCYVVPVDHPANRSELLHGMFEHMLLTKPANLEELAAQWQPENQTSDIAEAVQQRAQLGYYYNTHDYETLQRLIPVSTWALNLVQPQLQPFYESLGYRDLLWFK